MSFRPWLVLSVSIGFLSGCGPATSPVATGAAQKATPAPRADDDKDGHDHDHEHDHDHDAPETVAEAITQLEKMCADTKAHLAARDFDKADGPVHMVGHLLEACGDLVAKEKPAAEAEARRALDAIFECFDKFDTAIHAAAEEAREKLDYAEHAPAIEAAIAKLKELAR